MTLFICYASNTSSKVTVLSNVYWIFKRDSQRRNKSLSGNILGLSAVKSLSLACISQASFISVKVLSLWMNIIIQQLTQPQLPRKWQATVSRLEKFSHMRLKQESNCKTTIQYRKTSSSSLDMNLLCIEGSIKKRFTEMY